MLYNGTEEEKETFFGLLQEEGDELINEMYQDICISDGLTYPYEKEDFKVEILERGGIRLLQICLPPYNPDINSILRVYFLFSKREVSNCARKYFMIKRFSSGEIFNIYVTSKFEQLLGEELTLHAGDMEYEYWKLVCDYAKVLIQESETE